jgi:hypothetical protein
MSDMMLLAVHALIINGHPAEALFLSKQYGLTEASACL